MSAKSATESNSVAKDDGIFDIDDIIDEIDLLYDELDDSEKLGGIINKLKKIKADKENKEKQLEIAERRIKEYNRCVDIVKSRYLFGVAFNDTIVSMIDKDHIDLLTNSIIGFVEALPRQMMELMFHKIDATTDELCKQIIDYNKLSYVLLDTKQIPDINNTGYIIFKIILNIMNIIKDASRDSDIYFGPYKITNVVYISDGSCKNINYHISAIDDVTNDDIFIEFNLQSAELQLESLNITSLCMNNNGIVVRTKDFSTVNNFEIFSGCSILNTRVNQKKPVYGGFFQVINDIFNCRGRILNKRLIDHAVKDLNTKTLNRHNKVNKILDIIKFYNDEIHILFPRYINKTNMAGLPDYYIETKEECLYTTITPPYFKLKLECGHDISLQALYGILIDGHNVDSEAIECQLCREKLVFKLIAQSDAEKEQYKDDCDREYPRIYSYDDFSGSAVGNYRNIANSRSNKESNDFVRDMMLKGIKDHTISVLIGHGGNFDTESESEGDDDGDISEEEFSDNFGDWALDYE